MSPTVTKPSQLESAHGPHVGPVAHGAGPSQFVPAPRQFGPLIGFSYVAAILSVHFLRRIPSAVPAATGPRSRTRPPWGAMLRHPPFRRYLIFSCAFNVCAAALGVIWLTYMRDGFHAPASTILGLTAYANILSAIVSNVAGRAADRVGSRPLLGSGLALVTIAQAMWTAVAAGALPRHLALAVVIISLGSSGFAMLNLASTRLLMGLVPELGRSHFFAIAAVAAGIILGVMPVLWGLGLDATTRWIPQGLVLVPHWNWNAHSIAYALVVVLLLGTQFLRRRLDEPRAMSTEDFVRLLLVESPARFVSRALAPFRRLLPPL